MMLLFFLLSAVLAAEEEERKLGGLGDRLDFVERNVFNILRHGHFPELYNSSHAKIKDCGCYYSPTRINFGSRVGLTCKRVFGEDVTYDEENCGPICNDPHSSDIVMFCPHGWDMDCDDGCFPQNEFGSLTERIDFWELTVTSLMMYGHDYTHVALEYLEACGCEGKIRPIKYGTNIGFDCVLGEGKKPTEDCVAQSTCTDFKDRQIVTFCPAGHEHTCNGCKKVMQGNNDEARVNWMTLVITSYARESLTLLGWTPPQEQILGCACVGDVHPILYGGKIGLYCMVGDKNAITDGCGPNVLCQNTEGKYLVHFCPDGFRPSCDQGCTAPWEVKEEL